MIVSKPKKSTLTSLGLFLILIGALIAATITSINRSDSIYWYHYLFLVILVPVELGVFIKVVFSYKVVTIKKEKIMIRVPAKFQKKSHAVREIKQWKEVVIKTASGFYQQVEITFTNDDLLTLSKQEHSEYDSVISYLQKKAGKKRLS